MSRRDLIRMTPEEIDAFLAEPHSMNIATYNHDGTIHLVAMWYGIVGDSLSSGGAIGFETFAKSQKVLNLRRDPRASFHVSTPNGGAYAVAEGIVTLTPPAAAPDDATVAELVEVYRRIRGEHPDWADYRAAMVADGRLVIRLAVDRLYGWRP